MPAVDPRLSEHRDVWEKKPGLRAIYADYHRRLLASLPSGEPLLEIGGGSGNLGEASSDIISVDLLASPWVDVACDAHHLPFSAGAFGGIAMLDVLHHLAQPVAFFDEAARVLRPGGRLVMIETGITPLSWPFYHFLHQEPVDMSVDPLADQPPKRPEVRLPRSPRPECLDLPARESSRQKEEEDPYGGPSGGCRRRHKCPLGRARPRAGGPLDPCSV